MSVASRRILGVLAAAWLAALVVGPLVGTEPIAWSEVLAPDSIAGRIFWRLRLPRVLLALLAGGALAIGGAAFQALFRNPLAEPYTLGVASGAALGAVLAQQLGSAAGIAGAPLVAIASCLGAFLVTALIVALAAGPWGVRTQTLLLAGIAVSLSCSALILFVQFWADFTRTFRMVRWMMGGLATVGYGEVAWVAGWVAAGAAVLLARRWELDLLLAGEETAASRGVDLGRLRIWVLVATSGMVGALVAVTGPIGFIGLIVPHLLRGLGGHGHRFLLPACLLGGGVFLTLSDVVARRILAPVELPVGVLTALLGGPFFLWLLLGRRAGVSGRLESRRQ
jgi:iron complex transport system permease protein